MVLPEALALFENMPDSLKADSSLNKLKISLLISAARFDEASADHDPEKLRLLDDYYSSGEWREDYEADERGELPPDLKRGVLSQDALYDLLETSHPSD